MGTSLTCYEGDTETRGSTGNRTGFRTQGDEVVWVGRSGATEGGRYELSRRTDSSSLGKVKREFPTSPVIPRP